MANKLLYLLVFTTLLSFSWRSEADCPNPLNGESKQFFVSIYVVDPCNPNGRFAEGTEIIEFYVLLPSGEASVTPDAVPLLAECVWTSDRLALSCIKTGKSPLAGATYMTTRDKPDDCDETGKALVNRWTCLSGCDNNAVPQHLERSPWEC